MATYDKLIYDIPAYQEGNLADFEFDLDDAFPIADVNDITFQVRTVPGDAVVMSKKKSLSEITLTGRTVKVVFLPADTTGKAGNHVYELDFVNSSAQPFATIGGAYVISKQVNTL